MTEWLARRIWNGNVLCGRMAGGQHHCHGPIGAVDAEGTFYFLPGTVEDPQRPGWWQPTARSAERIKEGRWPRWHRNRRMPEHAGVMAGGLIRGSASNLGAWPDLPARYPCPTCRCIAVVDSPVLE